MNDYPGEYKIIRPIEIRCEDCAKISIPKYQMERNEVLDKQYMYSDGCLTLCDECMAKGWTSDPIEIIDGFNKDPKFQIGYQSPIQRHDLGRTMRD